MTKSSAKSYANELPEFFGPKRCTQLVIVMSAYVRPHPTPKTEQVSSLDRSRIFQHPSETRRSKHCSNYPMRLASSACVNSGQASLNFANTTNSICRTNLSCADFLSSMPRVCDRENSSRPSLSRAIQSRHNFRYWGTVLALSDRT